MSIKITVINPETGKRVSTFNFDNSIDANKERDLFDQGGIAYIVEWDCR